MRTIEEMQTDMKVLAKEINAVLEQDTKEGGGTNHLGGLAFYAVLEARPDLKKRYDDLMKEGKEYQDAHPELKRQA